MKCLLTKGTRVAFLFKAIVIWYSLDSLPLQCAFSQDLPNELRESFDHCGKRVSPLQIEWQRQRTSEISADQFRTRVSSVPRAEFLSTQRQEFIYRDRRIYCFQEAKFTRYDTQGKPLPAKPLRTQVGEFAFDIKKVYIGSTENQPAPRLSIESLEQAKRETSNPYLSADYFHAAGIWVPTLGPELGEPISSQVLRLLVRSEAELDGVEQGELDGRSCTVVRMNTSDRRWEFYLDGALEYAMRRRIERDANDNIISESLCSQFVQIADRSIWLPRNCRVLYYAKVDGKNELPNKSPLYEEIFTVLEISGAEVNDNVFSLQYTKPGTWVRDRTLPGADADPRKATYQIPGLPSDFANADPGSPVMTWKYVLIIANVAVFLFILFYLWRSRMSRS